MSTIICFIKKSFIWYAMYIIHAVIISLHFLTICLPLNVMTWKISSQNEKGVYYLYKFSFTKTCKLDPVRLSTAILANTLIIPYGKISEPILFFFPMFLMNSNLSWHQAWENRGRSRSKKVLWYQISEVLKLGKAWNTLTICKYLKQK